MKNLPKTLIFILFFITSLKIFSQCDKSNSFPTKCVLIESILVDACSNPEGANEMIKIRVGLNPISISDITISWPNNPWRGFASEAVSTPLIATLNNEITSCGRILYPPSGILPAGAEVLIFCSSDYQMGSHSFAGLQDTIYVLFQNPGNTNGHFANYVGSGSVLRTTSINVAGANGCTDVATYNRSLLVMQNGNIGGQDGGTVLFFENKNPEYINVGCTPPIPDFSFSISANKLEVCPGDSVILNASLKGQACVKWFSNLGQFNDTNSLTSTFSVPHLPSKDTIKIFAIAKPNSCLNEILDSITLIVLKSPEVNLTTPDSLNVCGLDSVELTVATDAGNPILSWQFENQNITNTSPYFLQIPSIDLPFYVEVSFQNSCGISSDSVYLFTSNNISVFAGKDTSICSNQNLLLNGTGNGNNPTWFTNGKGSFGDSNSFSTSYIPHPSDNSQITMYLRDENNCGFEIDSFRLNIHPLPNPFFECDTIVCENHTFVRLYPDTQGGLFSGVGVIGDIFTPQSPGLFSISHVVGNGVCVDSFKRVIRVEASPIADFDFSPSDEIKIKTSVDFINNSTGENLYEWLINSDYFYSENTSYYFEEKGTFPVRLIVFDSLTGCSDTVQKEIEIIEDIYFYIGNTFTPNGDSLNDRFVAVASGYSEINMFIYNRWGELLFKTNDATVRGWDGTYRGRECSSGVYVYIIEMIDKYGKKYSFNGTIHLIR